MALFTMTSIVVFIIHATTWCGVSISSPTTLHPFILNVTTSLQHESFTSSVNVWHNRKESEQTFLQQLWYTRRIYVYISTCTCIAITATCILMCIVLRKRNKRRTRGRSEPPKPFNFEMTLTGHSLSSHAKKHSMKIIRVISADSSDISSGRNYKLPKSKSREHNGHQYVGATTEENMDTDMFVNVHHIEQEQECQNTETVHLKERVRDKQYEWIINTLITIAPHDAQECIQSFKDNMVTDDRLKDLSMDDWKDLLPMIGIRNDFIRLYGRKHPPGTGEASRHSSIFSARDYVN